MRTTVILFLLYCLTTAALADSADFCPPPPDGTPEEIKGDAKLAVGRLRGLSAAELDGTVEIIPRELFSEYPNADRLIISQLLMSQFCVQVMTSGLSDREKFEQFSKFSAVIAAMFNVEIGRDTELPSFETFERRDDAGTLQLGIENVGNGEYFNLTFDVTEFTQSDIRCIEPNLTSQRFYEKGEGVASGALYRVSRGSPEFKMLFDVEAFEATSNWILGKIEELSGSSTKCVRLASDFFVDIFYDDTEGNSHQRTFRVSLASSVSVDGMRFVTYSLSNDEAQLRDSNLSWWPQKHRPWPDIIAEVTAGQAPN